ncbi:MAG: UbiA family prenyltransferase [Candidatus Thermoplasmatota archaeon]
MRVIKTVFEFAKLSSAHFIFLTAIIPLTGAIAMGEKDLFHLTILFLIGLSAHIVGFAFNHYMDIEVDRLSSATMKRPLPSGNISRRNAFLYILVVLFLGCLLIVYYYGVVLLLLYLVGIFLAGLYDSYSKRISGMDFVLASSVVVGVVFGAATVSFRFTPLIAVLCVLAFLQTLNLNLVAGGIKDADHDYLMQSQHLSTRLGVKVDQGVFQIPPAFQFIAYLLAGSYALGVFLSLLFQVINLDGSLILLLLLINVLFFIITYKMVHLKRFHRQQVRKYVVLQYTINWFNIPILLMSVAPLAGFLLLYPIIGLIVSNVILYRTILRPQVM